MSETSSARSEVKVGIGRARHNLLDQLYRFGSILPITIRTDKPGEVRAEPYLTNEWLVELDGLRVKTGKGYYLVFSSGHPAADATRAWMKQVT